MDATRKARLFTSKPNAVIAALTPEKGGRDPDVGYLLGIAHYRLSQLADAENALNGAVANGAGAEAYYYLGLCAERRGRTADAVHAYRKASALPQAAAKLAALAPGVGPPPHNRSPVPNSLPAAGRPPALNRQPPNPPNQLSIPQDEKEWRDYGKAMVRIEKIGARARNQAQLSGLPGWGKALVGLIAAGILAMAGFSAYEAVTENDVERGVREGKQVVCEHAAKQGVRPPGC